MQLDHGVTEDLPRISISAVGNQLPLEAIPGLHRLALKALRIEQHPHLERDCRQGAPTLKLPQPHMDWQVTVAPSSAELRGGNAHSSISGCSRTGTTPAEVLHGSLSCTSF